MSTARPHASSAVEIAAVSLVCFGVFIAQSLDVAMGGWRAQGRFDDRSLGALLLTEAALAALAIGILRWRRYPILRLGPSPTWTNTAWGVGLAVAAYLAWAVIYSLASPWIAVEWPVPDIADASHRSLQMVVIVSLVNGLYEEMFLLGYMMDALRQAGASIAIGLTLLVRMLYHLYQGPWGALSVTVWGLMIGIFYWRTKRLWPAIVAHELTDIVALA